jgi:three-Cys-motif partner protein
MEFYMPTRDRWPTLLDLVKTDDNLIVRECGQWTVDKLWFWSRYISITTTAMVGKPKWPGGLVYVDLFAGPGVCRVHDTKERIPGSPLIAANAPKPFKKIICVELGEKEADACKQRLSRSPANKSFMVIRGDCNEVIEEVVAAIPKRALTLAFIDPEGLDVHWNTLATLAENRRVDFLLLFADAGDLVRNIRLYESIPDSKLDKMLGPDSGWREEWRSLDNRTGTNIRALFPAIYRRQIERLLKYQGFREKVIDGPHGPLYRLVYASKHERGLEFWDKITQSDRGGQRSLFNT